MTAVTQPNHILFYTLMYQGHGIQRAIYRRLDRADYANLRKIWPQLGISQRLRERWLSRACTNDVYINGRAPCGQDPDIPDPNYVRVRSCQGLLHYPRGQSAGLGVTTNYPWGRGTSYPTPPRTTDGIWIAPKERFLHSDHNFVCSNCVRRDAPREADLVNEKMQRRFHTSHCKKHSIHPPLQGFRPVQCECSLFVNVRYYGPNDDLNNAQIADLGWRCQDCRMYAHCIVEDRANHWRKELRRTRRHKKGKKGRDKTISVYIDSRQTTTINGVRKGKRRGKGVACPIVGCGRSALTSENAANLVKTCLGCSAMWRVN